MIEADANLIKNTLEQYGNELVTALQENSQQQPASDGADTVVSVDNINQLVNNYLAAIVGQIAEIPHSQTTVGQIARSSTINLADIQTANSSDAIFTPELLNEYDVIKEMIQRIPLLEKQSTESNAYKEYSVNYVEHLRKTYNCIIQFHLDAEANDCIKKIQNKRKALLQQIDMFHQYLKEYNHILEMIETINTYYARNKHIIKLKQTYFKEFNIEENSSVADTIKKIEEEAIASNNRMIKKNIDMLETQETQLADLKKKTLAQRADVEEKNKAALDEMNSDTMSAWADFLHNAEKMFQLAQELKRANNIKDELEKQAKKVKLEKNILNVFQQLQQDYSVGYTSVATVFSDQSMPCDKQNEENEAEILQELNNQFISASYKLENADMARELYKKNFMLISMSVSVALTLTSLVLTGMLAFFFFPPAWVAVLPLTVTAVASSLIVAGIAAITSVFLFKTKIRNKDENINRLGQDKLNKMVLLNRFKESKQSSGVKHNQQNQSFNSIEARLKSQQKPRDKKKVNIRYWYTDNDVNAVINAACSQVGGGRADGNEFNYLLRGKAVEQDKDGKPIDYQGTLPELACGACIKESESHENTGLYDNVVQGTRYVVAVTPAAYETVYCNQLSNGVMTSAPAAFLDARIRTQKESMPAYVGYKLITSSQNGLKEAVSRLRTPLIDFLDNNLVELKQGQANVPDRRMSLLKICMYYKRMAVRLTNIFFRKKKGSIDQQIEGLLTLLIKIEFYANKEQAIGIDQTIEKIEHENYKENIKKMYKAKYKSGQKCIKELQEYAVSLRSLLSEIYGKNALNNTELLATIVDFLSTLFKKYNEFIAKSPNFAAEKNKLVKEFSKYNQDFGATVYQTCMTLLSNDILKDFKKALKAASLDYQDAIVEVISKILSIKSSSDKDSLFRDGKLYKHGKILIPVATGKIAHSIAAGHWKYLEIRLHYEDSTNNSFMYVSINYSDPLGSSSGNVQSPRFKEELRHIVMNRCVEELFYHNLRQYRVADNAVFNDQDILMLRLFYDEIFNENLENSYQGLGNWIGFVHRLLAVDPTYYQQGVNILMNCFPEEDSELKKYSNTDQLITLDNLKSICDYFLSQEITLDDLKKICYYFLRKKLETLFIMSHITLEKSMLNNIIDYLLYHIPRVGCKQDFSTYDSIAPKIQQDASACGVCSTEAIIARIAGKPLPEEQPPGALVLREKQIDRVFCYFKEQYKGKKAFKTNFRHFLSEDSDGAKKVNSVTEYYKNKMKKTTQKNEVAMTIKDQQKKTLSPNIETDSAPLTPASTGDRRVSSTLRKMVSCA